MWAQEESPGDPYNYLINKAIQPNEPVIHPVHPTSAVDQEKTAKGTGLTGIQDGLGVRRDLFEGPVHTCRNGASEPAAQPDS